MGIGTAVGILGAAALLLVSSRRYRSQVSKTPSQGVQEPAEEDDKLKMNEALLDGKHV